VTRARGPEDQGHVERDGVRVAWERYGEGDPAIYFLPTWAIVHSRIWKGQIPYVARHTRVITSDPRGNGRSDRPTEPAAYADEETIADCVAVMDATRTERAIVVGISDGGWFATLLSASHPERVAGVVMIGTATPLAEPHAHRTGLPFDQELDTDEGWRGKWNRHYWLRDYRGFLEWFGAQILNEPHSTKQREDFVEWGLDTNPETLLATLAAPFSPLPDDPQPEWRGAKMRRFATELYERIDAPVLVIHGDSDVCDPYDGGVAAANATGGRLVSMTGCGHVPVARYPVRINLLIREFLESVRAGSASSAAQAFDPG
jgi:pimeloyl-ACP methyl ester carboxylesterase